MPKLTPRQRSYIRKKTQPVDLDPSEAMGELNIVPFLDIVVNLIMFLLVTTEAVMVMSQIESDLPKFDRGRTRPTDQVTTPLNLNVTVTGEGVLVSGSGGKLGVGCEQLAAGRDVTVPLSNGRYDWPALTECVTKVKGKFADERTVTVSADPSIQYEHLVAAMDAIRRNGQQELFPQVLIAVGVR